MGAILIELKNKLKSGKIIKKILLWALLLIQVLKLIKSRRDERAENLSKGLCLYSLTMI